MILICFISLASLAQAGTVVPVQSSNVDVRQSGSEFSYNIQERRGLATIPDAVPIIQPLLKTVHLDEKPLGVLGVEHHVKTAESHQQVHSSISKAETRATVPLKEQPKDIVSMEPQPQNSLSETKKLEYLTPIAPPLIGSPLETIYYKTYNTGFPINVFPNGPLIPSIPAIYPYTLVRTA